MSEVVGRGTVLAGRYRMVQPEPSDLAGASAWQATDQILDRPVRVQVLESGAVGPALDAARRAALVSDPRLVRVLDVGTHDGLGYVVCEQVTGPSLAQLAARGPLPPDQARAVLGEVASALEIARRRGVHHLALRPSVLHVNRDGRVQVAGLALDATLLGVASGDARMTSRTDAVGLVRLLYAALTGRWPDDARLGPLGDVHRLPSAPLDGDVPVAPADLVPGVPADLDTLCVVTLGPHDDGPHSPGELVRELEPWGAVRPVDPPVPVGMSGTPGAGPHEGPATTTLAAAALGTAGTDPGQQDTVPLQVQRQSVRAAFRSQQSPGANLPGTPPPAAPPRTSAYAPVPHHPADESSAGPATSPLPRVTLGPTPFPEPGQPAGAGAGDADPAGAGAGGAGTAPEALTRSPDSGAPASRPGPSTEAPPPAGRPTARSASSRPTTPPPAVPVDELPRPVQSHVDPFDFDTITRGGPPQPTLRESVRSRRFDPTALVLALVAAVVVIGVVLAARSLFAGIEDRPRTPAAPSPSTSTDTTPSDSPSDTETSEEPPPPAEPPAIASATSFDPSDSDGEHEEAVARAYDGDPSTYWYTLTYKRADFAGFKDAVGYTMALQAPATVTSVTLHTNSTGGHVQLRVGDGAASGGGEVVAEGEFGPETVLTPESPVDTSSLTLWITELPTATDGSFRLELTEIALS